MQQSRPPSSKSLSPSILKGKVNKFQKALMYGVIVIPLVCVALLSTVALEKLIRDRKHIITLQHEMVLVEDIRQLIHTLQDERVSSCIYLRNNNENKTREVVRNMEHTRLKTDNEAFALKDIAKAWPNRPGFKNYAEFVEVMDRPQFRNYEEFLNMMTEGRKLIDKKLLSCSDTVIWLHKVVDIFIFDKIIAEFEYVGGQAKLWGRIHAYTGWILGREENDLGTLLASKLFSTGPLDPKQYSYYYRVEGAAYEFLLFSGTTMSMVRDILDKITAEHTTLLNSLNLLEHDVLLNNATEPDLNKATVWLDNNKDYNNLLLEAEQDISQSVMEELVERLDVNNREFALTLIVAIFCLIFCPLFAIRYLVHQRYTRKLAKKTKQIYLEEKKKGNLLYQLLPENIATQILDGKYVEPESFDCVTVFFSDIVNFTGLASESTPLQVVMLMNDLYTQFDAILGMHDCYKVETIGDGFLVVSGLPKVNDPQHSSEMSLVSLKILLMISEFKIEHMPERQLSVRIGLNTGGVVAGIVGTKRPYYCLFGDTVNTASRMETSGQGMNIHISESTRNHLFLHHKEFENNLRGTIAIKGKGEMTTYWLLGKEGFPYRAKPDSPKLSGNKTNQSKDLVVEEL